jgi:hypothetical protein
MLSIKSPLDGFLSPFGVRRGGFSPAVLFAASEPGVWYDPSDTSTLFSDTAGTTPATIGGTVALMLDKSGNDLHATQPTAASRPTLRQAGTGEYYLEFDGADDGMVTPTITPGVDKVQVFAGARKLSDAAAGALMNFATAVENGSLEILAPLSAGNYRFSSKGTIERTVSATGLAAPVTNVLTCLGDIGGDSVSIRVDGTQRAISTNDQGTGNYLAYPLFVGRRLGASIPFNGHIYSLITRFGPNLDADVIDQTEAYVAGKTAGVTL